MTTKKSNDLIVKSNTLNEASFKLDSLEYKFILFIASKIKKSDKDFHTLTVSVKDFINAIGVSGNAYHKEIEKLSTDIMKKPIKFSDENGFEVANWFSYIRYQKNEGLLKVRFDKVLKPFLLELEGNFFQYTFRQISQMKSTYSIRLFELLKQYVVIGERKFEVEYLRSLLGAENVYPKYSNFKQRVIKKAIEEIKEKTDLNFDFEEEKEGKRVNKLIFTNITYHPKHLDEIDSLLTSDEPLAKKLNAFFNPLGIFLKESDYKRIKAYDEQIIANAMVQLKTRIQKSADVDSPLRYLFGVLKNMKNIADEEKEEQDKEGDPLLDRHFWIAEIVAMFKDSKSRGRISKVLIQEKAESFFKLKGVPPEEVYELWKDIEDELIESVNKVSKESPNKRY